MEAHLTQKVIGKLRLFGAGDQGRIGKLWLDDEFSAAVVDWEKYTLDACT